MTTIVVPTDWEWLQEKDAIWTVYPHGGVKGAQSISPPTSRKLVQHAADSQQVDP